MTDQLSRSVKTKQVQGWIYTTTTNDVAAAHLVITIDERDYEAEGSAKRNPGDKASREIGQQVATARAFESLGRKLRREADGAVAHADSIREHHRLLHAAKKAPRKKTAKAR